MHGKPCCDLSDRPGTGVGEFAQGHREFPLLDGYGRPEIEERMSLHRQQRPRLEVIVAVFRMNGRHRKGRMISLGQEKHRDIAAPQARVGPDIVGKALQLLLGFHSRQYGHGLPVAAQQGRNTGIMRAEIAVGIVASGLLLYPSDAAD